MKKIVTSLGVVVFVGALVVAGTGAFFSDTETSTANTFTAGALDLTVDSEQHYNGAECVLVGQSYVWDDGAEEVGWPVEGTPCDGTWEATDLGATHTFFNFSDIKPGDFGENTISLHVDSNDAFACVDIEITENDDVDCTEPEEGAEGAGVCNTDGDPLLDGELAENLNFFAWSDWGETEGFGDEGDEGEGDNIWQVGEPALFTNNLGPAADVLGGVSYTLADSSTGPLEGGVTSYIGLAWCAGDMTAEAGLITCDGEGMGNEAQTDNMVADIAFRIEQARHNEEFSCDDGGEEGRPVGAVLSEYVAPAVEVCDETVTGTESIQTALGLVTGGGTVCVDPSYDRTGDNVAIRMETADVTLAALVQGILLDVPVVLSADGVTVTGFEGTIGQAESPAEQAAFYFDGDATNASLTYSEVDGGVGAAVLTETGADNSGGLIENNVLSGATQGIYLNPHTGSIMIRYNDIDNNAAGIAGLNGALVVGNEFEHTVAGSEAIGVDSTHDANPATVEFNNFLDDTRVNTYGPIAGDLDAEDNFWGPNGGAAQTGGTDEVSFTPEAGAAFPHN